MLTRLRVGFGATLAGFLIAVSAYAQEIAPASPAPAPPNLAFTDGVVDLVLDGVNEAADPPVMLTAGDVLRTRNGRAEVVFGDGTLLHLAPDTEIDLLGDERLRLTAGRVLVRISHAASQPYVIDTPASSVRLDAHGEYGITADRSGRLEVNVARGSATVADAQEWTIRGGQMLTLRGSGGRPLIAAFNSARWDAFESWSYERANGIAVSVSAAQLPYELRPYAPTLDRHGRWDYVAPHGYVWFPSVGAAWRPYYDGSWAFTHYGWTWHGRDRWAWPTHHYGRWGYTGSFWYWIPASVWAPAWVTWSVGAGYVSWAPLGWHTPSRFDTWRDHPAYAPRYSPWRGWTVLPRQQFGPRRNVRAHAIDGERLDNVAQRMLLSRATPARTDDVAVPRQSSGVPARGNVRRPPSYPPRSARGGGDGAVATSPGAESAGAPSPSSSWSGAARRVSGADDRGSRDRARPRGAGEAQGRGQRAGEQDSGQARDTGGRTAGEGRRGGAVRSPNAGSDAGAAPRSAPKGAAPSTRQPRSSGAAGGAAVPRSGSARPKG